VGTTVRRFPAKADGLRRVRPVVPILIKAPHPVSLLDECDRLEGMVHAGGVVAAGLASDPRRQRLAAVKENLKSALDPSPRSTARLRGAGGLPPVNLGRVAEHFLTECRQCGTGNLLGRENLQSGLRCPVATVGEDRADGYIVGRIGPRLHARQFPYPLVTPRRPVSTFG